MKRPSNYNLIALETHPDCPYLPSNGEKTDNILLWMSDYGFRTGPTISSLISTHVSGRHFVNLAHVYPGN